ncbi:GGDEF domain-containing protein [Loktanella agnita]|uniref:GGDEF domain-containing protein n=1 Tax=Loktanella agnita TaxID=287097 RepID=UPI00398A4AFE
MDGQIRQAVTRRDQRNRLRLFHRIRLLLAIAVPGWCLATIILPRGLRDGMNASMGPGADTTAFTSLCLLVVAVGLLSVTLRRPLGNLWFGVAVALTVCLSESLLIFGTPDYLPVIANHINDMVARLTGVSTQGRMGADTGVVLMALLLSAFLYRVEKRWSFLAALVANVILSNSFIGMAIGAVTYGGHMALTTVLALAPLAVLSLLNHLEISWMRSLLRNSRASTMAWLGIVLGWVVPWMAALTVVLWPTDRPFSSTLDALIISILSWSMVLAFVRGALKSDQAERALQREILVMSRKMATDNLTGLLNRHGMVEQLNERFAAFRRRGRNCMVVLMDLDRFKALNDTFGHDAGDCVLEGVGHMLKESLRLGDKAGRWGGEEFMVLCEFDAPTELDQAADRLRAAVAQVPPPVSVKTGALSPPVTASCGFSVFLAEDESWLAAINRADAALGRAKGAGRNCAAKGLEVVHLIQNAA